MAILYKKQLLDVIVSTLHDNGWNVLYFNSAHPFRIRAYNDSEGHNLKIIIYNLSHGGGFRRPANEYRIQLKVNRIEIEPDFQTLILGYKDDIGVFAGFDLAKHLGEPGYSASLQIKIDTLNLAYRNGFATTDKGNGEIAVAFKPEFFMEYVKNYNAIHAFGNIPEAVETLERAVTGQIEINNSAVRRLTEERRIVIRNLNVRHRDSGFTNRVLNAYSYHCAVCGLQLKLIDASHILPVNTEGSTDETSNGIALCALHHRAYDRSLITFNERYEIIHNENKMSELVRIGHDGKKAEFLNMLRDMIILPPNVNDRPHTDFIARSNRIRGWR